MPELPRISGSEAVKTFKKLGFFEARQKGSHVVMRKDDRGCVIPLHISLAIGTLRSAIRKAGISDFYNRCLAPCLSCPLHFLHNQTELSSLRSQSE